MKSLKVFLFLVCLGSGVLLLGQQDNDFRNCTAILLNNKLVVNEYSPEGKCTLLADATGTFTVQPVSLYDDGKVDPQGKRRFKIVIRDGNSKTLYSFSDKIYEEIEANKVLSSCKKGDSVVFITLDRDLALPHNEILVQ